MLIIRLVIIFIINIAHDYLLNVLYIIKRRFTFSYIQYRAEHITECGRIGTVCCQSLQTHYLKKKSNILPLERVVVAMIQRWRYWSQPVCCRNCQQITLHLAAALGFEAVWGWHSGQCWDNGSHADALASAGSKHLVGGTWFPACLQSYHGRQVLCSKCVHSLCQAQNTGHPCSISSRSVGLHLANPDNAALLAWKTKKRSTIMGLQLNIFIIHAA